MNKNILIGILGVLALITIAVGTWFFYFRTPAPVSYSASNTPTAVLQAKNQDFINADSYRKVGEYNLALQSYKKALIGAQDQTQAAQIRVLIAVMNEQLGNYKDAIAEFKSIAADPSNYANSRAHSVQEIGLMYYLNIDTAASSTIFAETFKDAPYDSFQKGNSENMAYIKLFEYALSLYPSGPSAARVAYGYANEITQTLHGATTTPEGMAYLTLIKQNLQIANAGIERMKTIPEESTLVAETFAREGATVALLLSVGAGDPKEAELYFQSGAAYNTSLGNKPGSFNVFNYAAFLADYYGVARSSDIKKLLLPFRVGNDAQIYPNVVSFCRAVRTDTSLVKYKKQIIKMGRIDSDFKTYLISLGWKASDF